MTNMRAALAGHGLQPAAAGVDRKHNVKMSEARCRPFDAEYAWAFDLLIDRPVGKDDRPSGAAPIEHFELLARNGARFDLPNKDGVTAAEIMSRKRDPRFRALPSITGKKRRGVK